MRIAVLGILLMLFVSSYVHSAEVLPTIGLYDLEKYAVSAPDVLLADMELKRRESRLRGITANNYWEVFGGVGTSENIEVISNSQDREYQTIAGRIGLRYPLLGTQEEMKRDEEVARIDADTQRIEKDIKKSEALVGLRNSYIDYWSAQQQIAITQDFLVSEEATKNKLSKRVKKNYLLESDFYEFISVYSMARRDMEVFKSKRDMALSNIRYIAGKELPEFLAIEPQAISFCRDMGGEQQLFRHPLLLKRKNEIDKYRKIGEHSKWSGVQSDFTVSHGITYETNPDGDNHNLAASINFRMPVSIIDYNRSKRSEESYRLEMMRLEYDIQYQKLLQQFTQVMRLYRSRRDNLAFAEDRAIAANAVLRQEMLRLEHLDGDVIEKVVKAKNNNYRVVIDYIEAQASYLQAQVVFVKYGSSNCIKEKSSRKINENIWFVKDGRRLNRWHWYTHDVAQRIGDPKGFADKDNLQNRHGVGLYVWDSQELIKRISVNPVYLQSLANRGVGRLVVSFNGGQLRRLFANRGTSGDKDPIVELISEARNYNIAVEILIDGIASTQPEKSERLINVIRDLSKYSFEKMHLKIESNQLSDEKYSPRFMLDRLVGVVAEIKAVSPWPIALSLNYQYVGKNFRSDLLSKLKQVGVDEISVTIYEKEQQKVLDIALPIIRDNPEIKISIVQRVGSVMDRNNSYLGISNTVLMEEINKLKSHILYENFNGIIIQSWKNFMKIKL